ncbi:MAG TPA: MFS transporter [Anaerolineae bacterium]|nr:MFS transporter [Anaerolineae bacterium]
MIQLRTPSRVLVPLGLAVCLSLFGDLTLYAVLVTQLDVVGLSLGTVGVMLGVNRLIRIPSNPLAGALLDRWGRRRLFIFGMLLGVLSTASYGLVRGFWPFLLSRLVWGIAWTLINVGGMAMVLDVSTRLNRGRLTGLYNTWLWAGFAFGPLVGGFLVDIIGFRLAMLTCAGLTAVGLAVVGIALPETARSINGDRQGELRPQLNLRRRLGDTWRQGRDLLHADHSLATLLWLFLITQFAGEGVVFSTISLLLRQRFGQNVALGSLMLGVASASGALLALRSLLASAVGPLAGHLSDTYTGRWPVIVGSLVAGIVGFGLLAFAASPGAIVLGVALGAASGGAALATLAAQVGDLTPPGREGVVMGAYATAGDVGSMAGPFLAFALLLVVDLRWIYLLCTFTFLAGLWLTWRSAAAVTTQGAFDSERKV